MNGMMPGNTVVTSPGFITKPFVLQGMAAGGQSYSVECETIRSWLSENCQGVTGEISPVFHMQDGIVRKIEMESRRVIFKK